MKRFAVATILCLSIVLLLSLTDASARTSSARTKIVTVAPFARDGHLRPKLRVTRQRHGSCLGSILLTNAAYRCNSGNWLLDPCWRDVRTTRPAVICLTKPWAHSVTRLLLKTKLFPVSGQATFKAEPWGIRTASGARCLVFEGAHDSVQGPGGRMFVVDYYCGSRATGRQLALVRGIDRSGATWRIRAVLYTGKRGHPFKWRGWVPIRTAWFGGKNPSPPSS